MMKQKLPKNWIVLHSKTHPDRVYYFNVKTNKSSWDEPTEQQSEQTKKKSEETNGRRKSVRPSTPERDVPESEIKTRKKLIARRSLKPSLETSNERQAEKETPQMRAIREKMLAKKGKKMVSKTQSPKGSKDNTKSSTSSGKEGGSLSSPSESNNSSMTNYTPEMQVMFQKLKQKKQKDKSKTWKAKDDRDNSKAPEKLPVKQQLRNKEKSDQRRRTCDPSLIATPTMKRSRKSLKKNMGKERMEQLRRSLTLENSTTENSDNVIDITQSSPSAGNHVVGGKLPSIYKNIEVRLTRLKDKVSKDKILINKTSTAEKPKILSVETVTTVNDLVKRSNDSFYEEMDWEPLEDEKITFEVQAVRTQLCTVNSTEVSCNVPNHSLNHPLVSGQQEKKQLYIVVDTNVFLTNISAIDLAKETVFKTFDHPFIVIPWTVIRELDYIKDNNSKTKSAILSAKARKAINYINQLFSSKHPYVIGQTREDAARNKEKFFIDCPDDEILQTCLQIRELGKSVVLMSNDINLRNKAMIYDVETLARNDPLEKIDYLNATNSMNSLNEQSKDRSSLQSVTNLNKERHIPNEIFNHVKITMKEFLTMIVSHEMHALYGDSWERHVIIRPPWTVVTVFQCAVKHWIAAVSESFLRKAEIILKELLQIFREMSGDRTITEVICILNKCSELAQMVNVAKHPELIIRVCQRIDELKQQCRTYENQLNDQKLWDVIGFEDDVVAQERRAQKAFQYFEAAYTFARDMCGLAANTVGMPCSFHFNIPNPPPSPVSVKQIQPELAANVNRLLHTLSAVLEQVSDSCTDYRSLDGLHQALVTFLPECLPIPIKLPDEDLSPLDIYCCVKLKEEVLKTGLRQIQEISTHFCRLASYRCT